MRKLTQAFYTGPIIVSPMGKPGRWQTRGLMCTLVIAMMLASSLVVTTPAEAAAGDLAAPVLSDGDWWNYTWKGPHAVPAKAGPYELEFDTVQGWLKFRVDGTTSKLGRVSWVVKMTGRVRLAGGWTSGSETGDTEMTCQVSGIEHWGTEDLAHLGSSISYTGSLEISTQSGPSTYDLVIWENMTLSAPLRLMTFPVPIAKFPSEQHSVAVRTSFESGTFAEVREEAWEYRATYRGLSDVQGSQMTYVNQHRFQVVGNVTSGQSRTPIDRSLYFESTPRKAFTVSQVRGLEVQSYELSQTPTNPDLVVASGEFNVTDYRPREGEEVNFTATVHNLGVREVSSVTVELWAGLDDDRPGRQNSTLIKSIMGNQRAVVHFNWTADQVGKWDFFLRVDPTNYVAETRENNNEATLTLVVVYNIPKPNLYVAADKVTLDPPSPVHNRTAVKITATIGNEGPGDARNVTVDMFVGEPGSGGVRIGWRVTIDHIPAAQTRSAWINWGADVPGNLHIWIYVDANNSVNETVETDNLGSVPLIVIATPKGEVDLVVAAVRILDSNLMELEPYPKGNRLTIRVTVTNQESNPAARVHMSIYVDTEDPQGLIGAHEGAIDARSLATWEVNWVVDRPDGAHQLKVTVVAMGDVEATFKDNVLVKDFTIGPRSVPEPEPLEVTIFPDATMLSPGQIIQVSGKVTVAKNGFEVPGAHVSVGIKGVGTPTQVLTNNLGRYLANVTAPSRPGTYRLEVSVIQGFSEGDNALTITVTGETGGGGGGGEDDDGFGLSYFVVSLIVLAVVVTPLIYYIMVSRYEIKRRIRRVHEEIVEIVEDEKK